MQLVYLWVEEYKNIKNQGFNFSPDFECKYDEKSNKLKIEPKKHTRIFPNNINVTAIVGENGSGKSSILEILHECHDTNDNQRKIIIAVKKEKSDIEIFTNIDKFDDNNIVTTLNYNLENNISSLLKSSLFFSLDDENINLHYTNPFNPYKTVKINANKNINFSKEKVRHEILYNLFFLFSLKKSIKTHFRNIFYPTAIELKINMFKALKENESNNSELENIINNCKEKKDGFELLKESMKVYLSISSQRKLSYITQDSMNDIYEKLEKYFKIEIITIP